MAEKYLTYTGLKTYDEQIKNWTLNKISTSGGTFVGYYDGTDFYAEAIHAGADPLPRKENCLYVDLGDDNKLYTYIENDDEYVVVSDSADVDISLNEATVACGGITKGTDLTGMTLQEILEAMLSPYVAPTSVSLSIAKTKTGYIEYGDTCQVTSATVRWTNGSVPVSQVALTGAASGTANPSSGATSAVIDFDDMTLSTSSLSFSASLTIPNHNSITVNATASNNFVYPIYYGSANVTADQLVASDVQGAIKLLSSGTQTLSITTVDSYPMIASTRRLSKVTDSTGITDYTNAFIGSETEINLSSDNPVWGPQKYYVYTGSRATLNGFQFKFTFA